MSAQLRGGRHGWCFEQIDEFSALSRGDTPQPGWIGLKAGEYRVDGTSQRELPIGWDGAVVDDAVGEQQPLVDRGIVDQAVQGGGAIVAGAPEFGPQFGPAAVVH